MKKKEIRTPRASRKLQQLQLMALSARHIPVIVHLSNGTRLQGIVIAADDYMLLLGRNLQDECPIVVYKRAITMITPANGPDAPVVTPDPASAPEFLPIYIPRTRRRR